MSLQFSCILQELLPPEICILALVRHISARGGQHQSGHYGEAGAGDCDQPRRPSDFTNRRKQSSPGPLTGLYLYHLSSRLPRRKSPGLCYFLNNICYVAEDEMVKESKLPAAQHGQLCLRLFVSRHCSAHWAQAQHWVLTGRATCPLICTNCSKVRGILESHSCTAISTLSGI